LFAPARATTMTALTEARSGTMFSMEANLPNLAQFAAQRLGPAPGRWHDSSYELQRGLEVIEHHWSPDSGCEALLELVSFE
jgi:hypothetical protein